MPTNESSPVIDFMFTQLMGEAVLEKLPGEPGLRHSLFENDSAETLEEF